uniref:Uncharacterized protein n=1 Tax=Strombidium rassoulzadegani TaxID=1082188 RepID=A0A7S3FZ74_9SPIT
MAVGHSSILSLLGLLALRTVSLCLLRILLLLPILGLAAILLVIDQACPQNLELDLLVLLVPEGLHLGVRFELEGVDQSLAKRCELELLQVEQLLIRDDALVLRVQLLELLVQLVQFFLVELAVHHYLLDVALYEWLGRGLAQLYDLLDNLLLR